MSLDILGPADAANAVTDRPAEGRTFGALDSWFKDCTSPDVDDGTEVRADFFNGLLATFRSLWRANGKLADGVSDVVPETGTDAGGLTKSVQQMIQRGQPSYCEAAGTANALVATLAPALREYKPGVVARVKIATTCTGPATINLNGLGVKPIIHPDGAVLSPRDLSAGMVAELLYDGASFQLVGAQMNILTAPRDYYVNPATGSDTNTGLDAGHPFQTVQAALNAAAIFNLNGFKITIHCAAGNYAQFFATPINGSGSIDVIGDITMPANCQVNGITAAAIDCGVPGYFVAGFKLVSSLSSPPAPGIRSFGSGNVTIKNMEFGACNIAHILADAGGTLGIAGASDNPTNFIRVSGSAPIHQWANNGGKIINFSPILQIVSAVTFSQQFINALYGQVLAIFSSITGAGFVSGARYQAAANGIVSTNGGGASYLPGTSAGVTQTGGQYL